MGQYFKFFNKTTNTESNVPIRNNFGLTWVKSLDRMEADEIRETFLQVITDNLWSELDDVVAIGDYGDKFYWEDYC